jgi:hypothetical protein
MLVMVTTVGLESGRRYAGNPSIYPEVFRSRYSRSGRLNVRFAAFR